MYKPHFNNIVQDASFNWLHLVYHEEKHGLRASYEDFIGTNAMLTAMDQISVGRSFHEIGIRHSQQCIKCLNVKSQQSTSTHTSVQLMEGEVSEGIVEKVMVLLGRKKKASTRKLHCASCDNSTKFLQINECIDTPPLVFRVDAAALFTKRSMTRRNISIIKSMRIDRNLEVPWEGSVDIRYKLTSICYSNFGHYICVYYDGDVKYIYDSMSHVGVPVTFETTTSSRNSNQSVATESFGDSLPYSFVHLEKTYYIALMFYVLAEQ
jgi:hypothetical protein